MRRLLSLLIAMSVSAPAFAQLKDATLADYHQWKLALQQDGVASPVTISTLPGFNVEVVRVAEPNEGSWISLAFDSKGRAVIGREDKGLSRLTLESVADKNKAYEKPKEPLTLTLSPPAASLDGRCSNGSPRITAPDPPASHRNVSANRNYWRADSCVAHAPTHLHSHGTSGRQGTF